MHKHFIRKRLYEIADKQTRLTEPELKHLEKCAECLTLYAKVILQVARARARDKCRARSISSVSSEQPPDPPSDASVSPNPPRNAT